ncbi:hypothetical protein [Streptomyces sp. NBC_01013]|uniref:hypothetical protein n=1 Tax=Streptomyces sp. NBC_01013 TaxID=2903718 RepID=UPI00386CDF5E|nr:hypothetical protein OG538_14695 [Streptomyces sp. NBC_01013]
MCAWSVALLAGCTTDSEAPDAPASSPARQRPHAAGASGTADEELGRRVEDVLDTADDSAAGPLFVEAGLERVGDGFHTRPDLARGHAYTLSVACEGRGSISLSVAAGSPVRRTVACDGVALRKRFTASASTLRIDGDGLAGATGMVGWRLDRADE